MTDTNFMAQYISDAVQTSSTLIMINVDRIDCSATGIHGPAAELFHAAIGISTEAGELLDAWKKIIAYGRAPDFVNMDEELGDLMWYQAVYWYNRAKMLALADSEFDYQHNELCNLAAALWQASMSRNIAKLAKRYPDRTFSLAATENRDLDSERRILEGKE